MDANGAITGWDYVSAQSGETEHYNVKGQLTTITNRARQTQILTYSDGTSGVNGGYVLDATGAVTAATLHAGYLIRVADAAGRLLQFGYDAAGRVVKMTDPAGSIYIYAYDANNNLTRVTYPDGKSRQYLYGEPANVSSTPDTGVSYVHALTGLVDENGDRYASWTYDAAGRATSSEHGAPGSGIDHVGLVYSPRDANGNSTTSVTDVVGVTRTYNFSTILGVVKNTGLTGQPCIGCSSAVSYDANGNISSRTDFSGNSTCYVHDLTRNLETVRLEGVPSGTACPTDLVAYVPPSGSVMRKITTQWHANHRLPTMIAEPLRKVSYAYDDNGRLLNKTIQPTSDATGGAGVSATANGTPRITTYTYYATTDARNGLLHTIDGPRTDVSDITTYGYDPVAGNLTSASNALGQATTLAGHDANGHPKTITDPNGLLTNLDYDLRGRLTSRSVGGELTSYTYDGVGNFTGITLPGGAAYTYVYDAAHRLTDIKDAQNNYIHYTLDAAGNRTKEELFDSTGALRRTHRRVFDSLNQLYQDIGAVNQTTTYAYDARGNLQSVTDPLDRQTVNVYDALNRLSQITNADGGIVKYDYDGLDQLTQVTDPRSLVTQYTRDGLGNLNQTVSPDTGTTTASYDAAGNLLARTDAKGQLASYTYDALNRLTSISYSGGTSPAQSVTYQYDQGTNGIGHLTQIIDATGTTGTTSYSYDQHGRLVIEAAQKYGTSYTTAYSYDTQGRLAGICYPSGRTVGYAFDGQGRVNMLVTSYNGVSKILASNIVYLPFGGVQGFTYGDGTATPVQTYARQADLDGRIASYTLNGQLRSIGYDAASQISFISDPNNLANIANYNYDPMSRLNGFTQGSTSQSFGYDTDGNRITQTVGSTVTTFGYGTTSNWLTGIQTGASNQSLSHDANGATTSDATRQYAYDNRGRLIQSTTAQGVINYEINALGLRVRKQVPYANADTQYLYDTQGHLISEGLTGTTQFTREYIYLGDIPVAVMQ